MKGSTSAEFSMKLGYDTLSSPQYNGNISTQLWGSSYANRFNYTYDKLNRLANGTTSTGIAMAEALTYDNMGNILTLGRDGGTAGSYNYTGNQLTSISSGPLATGSYAYDGNGNATTDGRLGATIVYNNLDLPISFTKSGMNIAFTYNADGQKLKKVNNITSITTDYVSGIQYTNGAIDFIQTEEGRALNNSGTYSYQYDLKDHLGNVRYSFDIYSGAVRKLQEDDYYTFGLRHSTTGGTNNYLYNGKELQDELGQHDYGARFYDPIIGRWNVVDPLAESSRRWSPFAYGNDNPIRFIDPDGMQSHDQLKPKQPKAKEPVGSYAIDFETGMKYHGKGPESRMERSAAELSKKHKDPVVNKEWKPAKNNSDDEAFKDEDDRINTQEGGHKNDKNYNKRASPGKKIKEKEAKEESIPDAKDDDSSQKTEPNKLVVIGGVILTVILTVILIAAAILN